MKWYFAVLKNYMGFQGRASRTEFWMFMLFNFIVSFVLGFIGGMLNRGSESGAGVGDWLSVLYMLAIFLPALAVQIRRLHDTNRSGWWSLIGLIPIIGVIVILIFCALPGTPGGNDYGEEPDTEI